jgi:hypothetical protein
LHYRKAKIPDSPAIKASSDLWYVPAIRLSSEVAPDTLELLQLVDTALLDLVVYVHSGGCGGGDSGMWEYASGAGDKGAKGVQNFFKNLNAAESERASQRHSPALLEFERLIALLLDQPLFFGDTDEVTAKLAETEKYDLLIHFLHERCAMLFFLTQDKSCCFFGIIVSFFFNSVSRAMHAAALRILQNKEESLAELKERMSARRHTVALMHRNLGVGGGDGSEVRVNDPRSLIADGDVRCGLFISGDINLAVVFPVIV